MIKKSWSDVNSISVIFIIILSFIGSVLHIKKYCRLNKEKCDGYSSNQKIFRITFHVLLDAISVGLIAIIVYLGMIGYGFNELISVAVAGFIAKEGNDAIYEIKLIVADKLNSQLLKDEIKKEKD